MVMMPAICFSIFLRVSMLTFQRFSFLRISGRKLAGIRFIPFIVFCLPEAVSEIYQLRFRIWQKQQILEY